MKPLSINLSMVSSEIPSILRAFLDANSVSPFECLTGHSGLLHIRVCVSLMLSMLVFSPHAGHVSGISILSEHVRLDAICGMIMFAL